MTHGTVVHAMTHGNVVHVTTQGKADGIVIHVMTHGTVGITHTVVVHVVQVEELGAADAVCSCLGCLLCPGTLLRHPHHCSPESHQCELSYLPAFKHLLLCPAVPCGALLSCLVQHHDIWYVQKLSSCFRIHIHCQCLSPCTAAKSAMIVLQTVAPLARHKIKKPFTSPGSLLAYVPCR